MSHIGNFGTPTRMKYGVLGDAVDIASRLVTLAHVHQVRGPHPSFPSKNTRKRRRKKVFFPGSGDSNSVRFFSSGSDGCVAGRDRVGAVQEGAGRENSAADDRQAREAQRQTHQLLPSRGEGAGGGRGRCRPGQPGENACGVLLRVSVRAVCCGRMSVRVLSEDECVVLWERGRLRWCVAARADGVERVWGVERLGGWF
eukprot:579443-Rhodomonas_salina.2